MQRILVTGAAGQIGSELTMALRERYGNENVIAAVHVTKPDDTLLESGPCHNVDCTLIDRVREVVEKFEVDTIYHLASILSAKAEEKPQLAWHVNMNSLFNILEVAREFKCSVFVPSSIGAFGPTTPLDQTPQDTLQHPNTMYGITKVAGELLCDYYFKRYGLDTRGVRYPGIVSYKTPPGGGTTDYACEIFYEAIKHKRYTCFLREDTVLPMMYMPDCIRAAIELMEADLSRLKHHSDFNLAAMSFSPAELAAEIRKHIPELVCEYEPDFRQQIADSWPRSIDDSASREEWGWEPEYDLEAMVTDMLHNLRKKHEEGKL